MGNLSVRERVKIVSDLASQSEFLRSSLELHNKILKIQEEIDNTPMKGTRVDWTDQSITADLREKTFKTKKPIIHYLDPSIFDLDILFPACSKVVDILVERGGDSDGLKKFWKLMENERNGLLEITRMILREDASMIENYAGELDLQPSILVYIIDILIQPCLEEITRKVEASFSDSWWQPFCPVCGRTPIVARLRSNKRYLACTFCGAEFLTDCFLCVHCGNKDPYTLKYMVAEGEPESQIDFCAKCRHYIKVIDEAKLKKPILRGLEDILTMKLDLVAKEADLTRD